MTAEKIEPCPVCGYRVALDKDGALPYNHPPVFKCCGYSTTDPDKWNSYARERRVGRVVLKNPGLVCTALDDYGTPEAYKVRKDVMDAYWDAAEKEAAGE